MHKPARRTIFKILHGNVLKFMRFESIRNFMCYDLSSIGHSNVARRSLKKKTVLFSLLHNFVIAYKRGNFFSYTTD
jgi:hypothetical protein